MIILYVVFFICIFFILISHSEFYLEVKKLEIDNDKKKGETSIKDYFISVGLKIWEIRFLKINYSRGNNRIKNIKRKFFNKVLFRIVNNKFKEISEETTFSDIKKIFYILDKFDLKIETFDLKMEIGTEDIIFTTFLNAFIASTISILLAKKVKIIDKEKIKYQITPNFEEKNFYSVKLESIFHVKLVHIINILNRIKRSDKINGRTSNRRLNAYSNV